MHYLLTGKDPLPLSQASPKSVCPDLDEDLDAVISKCCAFEPEDRYHSAAEVIDELKSVKARLSSQVLQVAVPEKIV